MAIVLKVNSTTGNLERFGAADVLDIDTIEARSGGHLVVGATLGAGDQLQLGNATGSGTGDVRVMGDLKVDGTETVTSTETVNGTFNANGDVNLGDNTAANTINLGGGTNDTVVLLGDSLDVGAGTRTIGTGTGDYLDGIWVDAVNANGPALAAYDLNASGTNAGAYAIGVDPALITSSSSTDLMTMLDDLDAAITGAGNTLQQAYVAGNTIAVTTAEGSIQFSNSADVTDILEVSRTFAGAGIGIDVLMGPGNEAVTGVGVSITSGTGATGDMLFVNNLGSGDALDVQDGSGSVLQVTGAGAVNVTPTSGQNITLTTAGAGAVDLNSDVTVGAGLYDIGASTSDYLAEVWVAKAGATPANAAYNLNETGANAGAYSIGVNPALIASSSATDLMNMLDDLDTAIATADTLQEAYAAGNTIAVTAANGPVAISNAADLTDTLDVTRTFVGAGIGIDVQMGPGNEAVTGVGVSVTSGTGATGDMLFVNNLGSGDALDVQDGGGSVIQVTGAGAVNVTPTSGQNLTMTAAGAGTAALSAAAAVTIDSTGAGVSIDGAGTSNFSTSSGNLTLDAAAGELTFDDTGGIGLELSDGSNRSFSGTILGSATSIVGAFNAITTEIEDNGVEQFVRYVIENGVTLAAGDCVAVGATAGRVQLADADGTTEQKQLVGICKTGGVGTVGSVFAEIWTPGALCTGAGFTAGDALFVPDTPGDPTPTPPATVTDLLQRVGWALSTTQFVLDPGPPVIL